MRPTKVENNVWEYRGYTLIKTDREPRFPYVIYDSEGFDVEWLCSYRDAIKYIDKLYEEGSVSQD